MAQRSMLVVRFLFSGGNMAIGRVKWFSDAKGYGFIQQEDGSPDIFVHFSVIEGNGFRSLQEGQVVEFDVQAGPKGMKAVSVRPKEQPAEA
jgi:cold shock protein